MVPSSEHRSGAAVCPRPQSLRSEVLPRQHCAVPTEIHENAISPADMSRVQEEALRSRHAELRDRLRGISQGFDRLRGISHQGYGAEAGECRGAPHPAGTPPPPPTQRAPPTAPHPAGTPPPPPTQWARRPRLHLFPSFWKFPIPGFSVSQCHSVPFPFVSLPLSLPPVGTAGCAAVTHGPHGLIYASAPPPARTWPCQEVGHRPVGPGNTRGTVPSLLPDDTEHAPCAHAHTYHAHRSPNGMCGPRGGPCASLRSPCSLPEFEEPRVIDLWDLARTANFTEKELESFRVRKPGGLAGPSLVAADLGLWRLRF